MPRAPGRLLAVAAVVLACAAPGLVRAQATASSPDTSLNTPPPVADLAALSLEQLSNVRVSSVMRRPQRLSETAASVYVITAEDIRRSGAQTLPEALRLCPTLQIARADANQYAISTRGFNSVLANKMLVMIDGRTVYSPLFSGVFWEAQDVLLQDVDRIEVISGPAGTTWGSNAVNGIINVISRSATQTKGPLVAGGYGLDIVDPTSPGRVLRSDLGTVEARYGWGAAPWYFRTYGKYAAQANSEVENDTPVRDASHRYQVGGRGRWENANNAVTFDGAGYRNLIDQVPDQRDVSGGYALGRWIRQPAQGAPFWVQAYYERTRRDQPGALLDVLDTYDIQFQNELRARRHTLVWGAGYRYQNDQVDLYAPTLLAFIPEDRKLTYTQLFGEDVLHVVDDLDVTLGLRVEHNVYTDFEWMPTARVAWRPTAEHMFWTAYSRAVRSPSRVDKEFYSPGAPPHFILDGGPDFESEYFDVAELGYRAQPLAALSYSVTAYISSFDRLRSLEPTPSGPQFRNGLEGDTHGLEVWANYRVTSYWRLSAGGTTLNKKVEAKPGVIDLNGIATAGNDPDDSWLLRSSFDIGTHHELDLWVRHVADLEPIHVPGYTTLDARVASRILPGFEVSVSGDNLIGPKHPEWGASPASRAVFGPSVFAQIQWRP